MKIRELFNNPGVDVSCNYRIYACEEGKTWHESPVIADSDSDGGRPRAELAEREISYIAIDNNDLIVEVR